MNEQMELSNNLLDELKRTIPFDSCGIAHLFFDRAGNFSLDALHWFPEKESFDADWFEQRLLKIDPIFAQARVNVENYNPEVHCYSDSLAEQRFPPITIPWFYKKMEEFSIICRCACFYRVSAKQQFVFLCEGKKLKHHETYQSTLERLVPLLLQGMSRNDFAIQAETGSNNSADKKKGFSKSIFQRCRYQRCRERLFRSQYPGRFCGRKVA